MLDTAHTPALPAGLPLLDRAAAAELARVSPATIQRWRTAGVLPIVRIGTRVLYRRATVLTYVAALTTPAGTSENGMILPRTGTDQHPSADTGTELLSLDDVRQALAVSSTTVAELVRTGELPSMRVHTRRLVTAEALATFVDQHAEAATVGPLAGHLA